VHRGGHCARGHGSRGSGASAVCVIGDTAACGFAASLRPENPRRRQRGRMR
jgi:hypothetical protein